MEHIANGKSGFYISETALKSSYEAFFMEIMNDQRAHWDIFVLINRKGYWDYKIVFPNGYNGRLASQKIMSDRYLEKLSRKELKKLLKGKNVVIYDDSLSNGSNLFYYFLLCKNAEANKVVPMVYALNISFPSEKSEQLMRREAGRIREIKEDVIEELIQEFVERLKFRQLLNTSEMDRMSRWQTVLYQKKLSPLVMDLPILNHLSGEQGKRTLLSLDQLERLKQKKGNNWQYVENLAGGLNIPIVASYFRYEDTLLESLFSNMFYDFVIKCKYEKSEEDENYVYVVFTPFAISRSTTFENVLKVFRLLFAGSSYADQIFEGLSDADFIREKMEKDDNICNALFRAVIYRMSSYIGQKFRQYIKAELGMDLEYDWKIMEENVDDSFIKSQKEWCQTFDEELFQNQLLQFHDDGSKIPPIAVKKNVNAEKQKATQERVNNYIRQRVVEKKKDIKISLTERIYTLETIEYELAHWFTYENEKERKTMMTSVCLQFLETNSFGNHIFVNGEEHVMFRGFRYGENSEILLHENLWFFYVYLQAFYNNVVGSITDSYQSFMQWLEGFFRKRGYMGIWISEDGFRFLRDYFGSIGSEKELVEEIVRRRYLIESNTNGVEESVQAGFIREAASIIQQWGKA
ncbi:MAG: hypothetical protein K2K56_04465 [Lachnospiraceae bacterium]|nr:hypothetical protein [Lachnospiraceae bacterium]